MICKDGKAGIRETDDTLQQVMSAAGTRPRNIGKESRMGNLSTRSAVWGAGFLIGLGFAVPGFADEPNHEHRAPPAASLPAAALSLADLEQLALQGNPTLVQAAANIDTARGRELQS